MPESAWDLARVSHLGQFRVEVRRFDSSTTSAHLSVELSTGLPAGELQLAQLGSTIHFHLGPALAVNLTKPSQVAGRDARGQHAPTDKGPKGLLGRDLLLPSHLLEEKVRTSTNVAAFGGKLCHRQTVLRLQGLDLGLERLRGSVL
jgi:hypothetical protein